MKKTNLRRFFVLPENIQDNEVTITGSDVNHIKNVLRFKEGDNITVFDGTGKQYLVTIKDVKEKIIGSIFEKQELRYTTQPRIILVQGIPKGSEMDFVIQKGTEIGINRVIPLISERTVVKLDEQKSVVKQKRWQKIAKSSAEQSGSILVPVIDRPVSFCEALDRIENNTLNLIAWESETEHTLREILQKNQSVLEREENSICIFIGPEGGFTYQEIEKAKLKGIIPVSLGHRILRTETAGLAMAVMILYETGALG